MTALFRIGYGLYVVTSNDGKKGTNGLIVNTVSQVTDSHQPCGRDHQQGQLLPTTSSNRRA